MNQELRHLRRISSVRSGNNLKFLTPAVYSGGWCPMRTACNICEDIAGMSYLIVGMPECATYSRGMNAMPEGSNGEQRRIYVLDANEVIFGCREGLIGALRIMDSEGARAILMIATCVTDLIGEDFEGVIHELQPELNARLSYITLGQFKNFGSGVGVLKTVESFGAMMTSKPASRNRANALFVEGWHNKNDAIMLPLIVDAMEERGVDVRRITSGAALDDYLAAPDAALNMPLSAGMQPLAAKMNALFDIPYAPLHNAISVADVDAVYGMIAARFGIEWGSAFDVWRDKAATLEERARVELKGLRYVMLPGVDMAVNLAVYLASFGMEPLLLTVEDLHGEDIGYAKRLGAAGYDPPVCRMMNIDLDIEVVRRINPDISLGYIPDPIEGFICVEEMGDFYGMTGYERTACLLERILNVLNTGKTEGRIDRHGILSF